MVVCFVSAYSEIPRFLEVKRRLLLKCSSLNECRRTVNDVF